MAEGEGELQLISRSLVRCLPSSIFLLLKVGCQLVVMIGSGRGQGSPGDPCSAETATVIGTDLSPIQPSLAPPNVRFQVDDCCDEWIHKRPFDFIHARGLYGCVADWDRFYSQALENLRPGGYFEQVEVSPTVRSDDGSAENTKIKELGTKSTGAADKFGKSFDTVEEMKDGMERVGFVDVTEHRFKLPVGPWPKDKHLKTLGRYTRLAWEESMEMWVMMLWTRVLGVL